MVEPKSIVYHVGGGTLMLSHHLKHILTLEIITICCLKLTSNFLFTVIP